MTGRWATAINEITARKKGPRKRSFSFVRNFTIPLRQVCPLLPDIFQEYGCEEAHVFQR